MASVAGVCRHAARLTARSTRLQRASAREVHSTTQQWAAQNFVMPAMSPTMTEGNIASWKVKEGDKFSTGDVLLEIETDKAQMDVEAQDEGIMAKIMYQDGAKSIKVGTRIAVLAEEGDDINSLDIPTEDTPAEETSETKSTAKALSSTRTDKENAPSESPESSREATPKSQPSQEDADRHPPATSDSKSQGQRYPPYPSVQHLLHQNNIPLSDASKIPASGPNGRLLKGDVLSYLGSIDKSYSSNQSKRLSKMSHLDLSNIQKAEPKPAASDDSEAPKAKQPAPMVEEEPATQVAVPISLAAVFATQRRIQESLGLKLPLATFIARASEIANENLPRAKGAAPSSDELFDAVLGLGNVKRTTRGHYSPQITALHPSGSAHVPAAQSASRRKEADVIDLLTGVPPKRAPIPTRGSPRTVGVDGAENVFSVSVTKGEESRARTYLERVKTVLEAEPGRCVL